MPKDDCTMVIFGGTGDLAKRKLVPAIYNLFHEGRLPAAFSMVGLGRSKLNSEQYRNVLAQAVSAHSPKTWKEETWQQLAGSIDYLSCDVEEPASYKKIKSFVTEHTQLKGAVHNYLYYLAVAPRLFQPIARNFSEPITEEPATGWRRIMVEKPFGSNLETAAELNKALCASFKDQNIYRVDHYLGKEMIQNFMVIRFVNTVFEPVWNNTFIDNVQITVAENEGIGSRAEYYDCTGALRDMVQSHLLQMLAVTAMEPPASVKPEDLLRCKLSVIENIKLWEEEKPEDSVVFGQYKGYLQEKGVASGSTTETFVALKLALDRPRWQGVPFYLRTGKKLAEKQARVTIQFKKPFCSNLEVIREGLGIEKQSLLNLLTLKVQPKEGVAFQFNIKKPAAINEIVPATMDFCQPCAYLINTPEAYEHLIADAIEGDKSRFSSWEEIERSWILVDEILESKIIAEAEHFNYEPETWGPSAAAELTRHHGTEWWS